MLQLVLGVVKQEPHANTIDCDMLRLPVALWSYLVLHGGGNSSMAVADAADGLMASDQPSCARTSLGSLHRSFTPYASVSNTVVQCCRQTPVQLNQWTASYWTPRGLYDEPCQE